MPFISDLNLSSVELAFHTERFWKKVNKTEYCWNWKHTQSRYGSFSINKKCFLPSRFSFELAFGKIDPDICIRHICRNDYCVNPEHLEALPLAELVLQGISPSAINHDKAKCLRGHSLVPENLYRSARGNRICKKCCSIRSKKSRLKKMEILNA